MDSNFGNGVRDASFNPLTAAQAVAAQERTAAAYGEAILAMDRCAARFRASAERVRRSEQTLNASEPVVEQLRETVEAYARALRAENALPERAVILVKAMVEPLDVPPEDRGLMRSAAVSWAIAAYFAVA